MSVERNITRKALVLPGLLGILVLGSAVVLAQSESRGREHHPPGATHELQWVVGTLGLTSDQQAAVDKIFAAHRDAAEAAGRDLMAARKALADQVHAEALDEGAIRQAAALLAALEADRAVGDATMLSQVRAQLTPAQRTQLQQKLSTHDGMMPMGPDGPKDRYR
jgi:Spy/CpxP family protein refolding chaperone